MSNIQDFGHVLVLIGGCATIWGIISLREVLVSMYSWEHAWREQEEESTPDELKELNVVPKQETAAYDLTTYTQEVKSSYRIFQFSLILIAVGILLSL